MPSFELNKLQGISATRALSESERSQFEARGASAARNSDAAATGKPGVALEVNAASTLSTPPVNKERIDQIRKALEDGSYPLVPAQIADAMIAARISFGVETK